MSYNLFPHYQSLESGTQGAPGQANRSIPDRILDYGIDKVLNPETTVLDLGCNRGYFGICLSPLVKHYTGLEADKNQLIHGQNAMSEKGFTNINYLLEKYTPSKMYGNFDIIICCAFHIYTDVEMSVFGKHLGDMLNPGGHLFLEGHPPGYHLPNVDRNEPEAYWNPLTASLNWLKKIEEKKVRDRELLRPFIHYQK